VKRRFSLVAALVFVAVGATCDLLLLAARGSQAPAWAHLWCSPSALSHHGGGSGTGLAALLGYAKALIPHWPHILPILVALATLVYLKRANARYHAREEQAPIHAYPPAPHA
jgi:hypothetical protein